MSSLSPNSNKLNKVEQQATSFKMKWCLQSLNVFLQLFQLHVEGKKNPLILRKMHNEEGWSIPSLNQLPLRQE